MLTRCPPATHTRLCDAVILSSLQVSVFIATQCEALCGFTRGNLQTFYRLPVVYMLHCDYQFWESTKITHRNQVTLDVLCATDVIIADGYLVQASELI